MFRNAVLFGLALLLPRISAAESGPIKIGVLLPLTGEFAPQGGAFREGAELAALSLNANGGVNGRPIQLVVEDTRYSPTVAHTAGKKLLDVDRIDGGILGTISEAMAAGPEFEKAKVPLVILWDSAPALDDMGDYVFGIGPWSPATGERGAEFLFNILKARSVVVIDSSNDWAEAVRKYFTERFTALGGTVSSVFTLNPSDSDFRTVIARAKQLRPDALYVPLPDNIIPFYKQLQQSGLKLPVVTGDVLTQELLDQLGAALEGVYQSQVVDPDSEATRRLSAEYESHFGHAPPMILYTAWANDAVKLLAEGFRRSGASPADAARALYSIKDFPGASGTISIDAKGSSSTPVAIYQVQHGHLVKLPGQ